RPAYRRSHAPQASHPPGEGPRFAAPARLAPRVEAAARAPALGGRPQSVGAEEGVHPARETPSQVTERQYKSLARYMGRIAQEFGLRDWDITLHSEPPDDDAALASVECIFGRKRALIRVAPDFDH